MPLVGADIAALRELAATYVAQSEVLRDGITTVDLLVDSTTWAGADADEFRSTWHSELRSQMLAAADSLTEAAKTLHRNADEQEQASMDDGSGSSPAVDPREVADKVGKKIRDLFEGLFGDRSQDPAPHVVKSETIDLAASGSFTIVGASADRSMTIETLSDGTYRVIINEGGSLFATTGTGGAFGRLHIGDYGAEGGAMANIQGGLHGATGTEYLIDSPEELEKFKQWMIFDTVRDIGTHSNPVTSLLSPLTDWATDGLYGAIAGYTPPDPVARYVEGGVDVGVDGILGDVLGPSVSGSGSTGNTYGTRVDTETGDVTIYSRVDASLQGNAQAGLSSSDPRWGMGANGTVETSSDLGVTLNSHGEITSVTMTMDAAGDYAFTTFAPPGTPPPPPQGDSAGRQVEVTIPVTDANRAQIQESLVGVGVLTGVSPVVSHQVAWQSLTEQAQTNGHIAVTDYSVDRQNYVDAGLGLDVPGIKGFGGSVEASKTTLTTDSYTYDGKVWK